MKTNTPAIKTKAKRGTGRDLFGELSEGMEALTEARQGKRKLRTHSTEIKPAAEALAHQPFEEIVEPIARSFDESGMTEEEIDHLVTQTRKAVRNERNRNK